MARRISLHLLDPMAEADDRALAARFAAGRDEAAFAGLVNRHARMVLGVCRRIVRDSHLAEDAFQAVFLVLARNPQRAVAAGSVGGWLFGIARRVGLSARRQEERRQRRLPKAMSRTARDPNFDDLLRVVDEELEGMPEALRAPLVACFLEERTQDEAARHLGWSLSTLRRRLDRAKDLLHARLVRRGVSLAAGLFAGAFATSAQAAVRPQLLAALETTLEPTAGVASLAADVAKPMLAMKFGAMAVALAIMAGGVGMGFWRSESPEPPTYATAKARTQPDPASFAYPKASVDASTPTGATLRGRVVLPSDRAIPAPRKVEVDAIKDNDFFAPAGELCHGDWVVDAGTRGIANVVVWLRPDSPPSGTGTRAPGTEKEPAIPRRDTAFLPVPAPRMPAPVNERWIEAGRDGFTPRITAARMGDRLVFNNPAAITFDIHFQPSVSPDGDAGEFNQFLPSGTTYRTEALRGLKGPARLADHIHPWVQGWVWTFDHPYFAVTDSRGEFRLEDVPSGQWRVVTWHEVAGYGPGGRFGSPASESTIVFVSDKP